MLTIGAQLGRYEIVAPLGKGGMGEVYRARDTRLGREVAIKVLPEHFAQDSLRLARFEREARAVAALSHPNILAIHDYSTEQGVSFAVMELLEGETLRDCVARAALPWRQALEIAAAVADGLDAAHVKGIIHRDLKPENLFLTADGRVKILDFGLARVEVETSTAAETATFTPALTESGTVMGTIGYMSPEQVRGLPVDGRSDLFSLGCVLYEMITGKSPFRRRTSADSISAILHEEPPALSDSGLEVLVEVECVMERSLAKDPGKRFQSAREFALALRTLLRDPDAAQQPLPTAPYLKPPRARERQVVETAEHLATARDVPERTRTGRTEAPTRPAGRRLLGGLKVLLGCGLLAVVLCGTPIAGVVWLVSNYVPKIGDWFHAEMKKQDQWDEVARFWRPPPADAGPELLFPAGINEYQLIKHDTKADITNLNIQARGRRAIYKAPWGEIELFVYPATKLEKEALLRRAYERLLPNEDSKSDGRSGNSTREGYHKIRGSVEGIFLSYEVGPGLTPNQYGVFWWDKDWLFLARSSVVRDPGAFLKDYLATLSGAAAPQKEKRKAGGQP